MKVRNHNIPTEDRNAFQKLMVKNEISPQERSKTIRETIVVMVKIWENWPILMSEMNFY